MYGSMLPHVDDLKKDFERNKQKLLTIKDVRECDKLSKCKSTGVYYIDEAGYTQKFRRWMYGQSRAQTFDDLDEDFSAFMKHLDDVLYSIRETSDQRYSDIAKLNVELTNQIVPGLYNLKKTYPDYEKIRCKIDSIIMSMIDFKDEVSKLNCVKSAIKARAHSFGN